MTMLREYPNDCVLNRYLHCSSESWCKGEYYLGGQVKLRIDDEITWQHLLDVTSIQSQPHDVANSWEMASIQRSEQEFSHFRDIYTDYLRIKKFNGLLRVIVFWLSPARKRATEKIFHPDNLMFVKDEYGELQLMPIKKETTCYI